MSRTRDWPDSAATNRYDSYRPGYASVSLRTQARAEARRKRYADFESGTFPRSRDDRVQIVRSETGRAEKPIERIDPVEVPKGPRVTVSPPRDHVVAETLREDVRAIPVKAKSMPKSGHIEETAKSASPAQVPKAGPTTNSLDLLVRFTKHCQNAAVAEVRKGSAQNICRRKVQEFEKTLPQHAKFPQIAQAQTTAKMKAEEELEAARLFESETMSAGDHVLKELADRIEKSNESSSLANVAELQKLQAVIDDIASRVSDQDQVSQSLRKDVEALKQENKSLKENNVKLHDSHQKLEAKYADLQSNHNSSRMDIGNARTSIQYIRDELKADAAAVADENQRSYSEATKALQGLRRTVEQVQTDFSSRNKIMHAESRSIEDIQSRVVALEESYSQAHAPQHKDVDTSTILSASETKLLAERMDAIETKFADLHIKLDGLDQGQEAMCVTLGGQLDIFENQLKNFAKSLEQKLTPGAEELNRQIPKAEEIERLEGELGILRRSMGMEIDTMKCTLEDSKRKSQAIAVALVQSKMQALTSSIEVRFQQRIDMEQSLSTGTAHLTKRFDNLMSQDMAYHILSQLGQVYPNLKDTNAAMSEIRQTVQSHTGSIDEYGHAITKLRNRLDGFVVERDRVSGEKVVPTGHSMSVLSGDARGELDSLTLGLGKANGEVRVLKETIEETRTYCVQGVSGFADHLVKHENSIEDIRTKVSQLIGDHKVAKESLQQLESVIKKLSSDQSTSDVTQVRNHQSDSEVNGSLQTESNGLDRPNRSRSIDHQTRVGNEEASSQNAKSPSQAKRNRQPVVHDEETAQLLNSLIRQKQFENRKAPLSPANASTNGNKIVPASTRLKSGSKTGSPRKKRKRAFSNDEMPPQEGFDDSEDEDYEPILEE